MAKNVISRKRAEVPGVEFPVWLFRADGRSAQAEDAKGYGDLMRAGYTSREAIKATPKESPAKEQIKASKAAKA